MDIEILVEEIMEAYESEPETDFGNPSINQAIRRQGIKAHIWDLLQAKLDDPRGNICEHYDFERDQYAERRWDHIDNFEPRKEPES